MPSIKIDIDTRKLRKLFRKLIARGENTRPVMREIAGIMMDSTEENFTVEGRPAWKRLKPSTKRMRKKQNKVGKILQVRRQLANSVSPKWNDAEAVVGSNLEYARIHQLGGTIKHPGGTPYITTNKGTVFMKKDGKYPKGTKFTKAHDITIPARPYLKTQPQDINEMKTLIGQWLTAR